jgi:hypothetical protein
MKKYFLFSLVFILFSSFLIAQNVGIGTTNPDEKLTVVGTIKSNINSNATFPHIHIHEAESEFGRIKYTNASSSQYFTLAGNPQGDSTLARFHIFNSDFGNIGSFTGHGRFGINATNPAATFHLNAQPGADPIRIQNNNNTKFRIFSNNAMVFGSNWSTPIPDVIRMETPNLFIGFDGNHVPAEMLEVDGVVRVNGFTKPYGQQNGYILTSDNNGYGTWQAPQEDADADLTNEIQYLGISNHSLLLSNANSVKLSTIADNDFREVVVTNRNATYPQIALDIDATESFGFNRMSGGSTLAFMNSDSNIVIKTDKFSNVVTGKGNISIGNNPHESIISGQQNIILGQHAAYPYTSNSNIHIGRDAGGQVDAYYSNVYIGTNAGWRSIGYDNVAIGVRAGLRVGFNSTYIGYNAGATPLFYFSSGGAFGYNAIQSSSAQYVIGNENTLKIGGYKSWSNLSDGRFKTNIKENVPGLTFIVKLRPVTYDFDRPGLALFLRGEEGFQALDEEYKRALQNDIHLLETGFIAQEVERLAQSLGYDFNGVIPPGNDHDTYAIAYSQFVVPLVQAAQELDEKNKTLEQTNQNLVNELALLRSEIDIIKKVMKEKK